MPGKKSFVRYSYFFLLPAILVYGVVTVLPNVMGLFLGFTNWTAYNTMDLSFTFNGLENFKQAFAEIRVSGRAISNTLYFAVFTTIMKNIFGLLFALVVNKELKTRIYLRSVIFMPMVISPIIISVIFKAIYEPQSGLLNTFLRNVGLNFLAQNWLSDIRIAMTSVCIMDIWCGIGFCMVLYLAGIQSIPKEYLEAAIVAGATGIQKFRYITLPLIMQSVSVNMLLATIGGLKVFSQVYALTNGGPADSTQVVQTYIYKAFSEGRYGFSSAISIVFTLVVAILSFAIIKPLRKKEVEY